MVEPRWQLAHTDEAVANHLQQVLGIHPVLCRILAQRGVRTFEEAKRFFRPSLQQLHHPFEMRDMEQAVTRLSQAVERGERILLYGDYDVDGTTGVALLYAFLARFHPHLDYYLPHREREGYGVSMAGIDYARQSGASLIVAVDCGIQAHAPIAAAKAAGIDVIVCDHHLPEGELPPAVAVLNPRRPDCSYPNKGLSGCGVAFKLAQGVALTQGTPAEELEDLLDLVALSTCCDLVPLTGENRVFAHAGIGRIERRARTGVWALVQKSRCSPPLSVRDLVFGIGPLINAAGRMGDARDAVRLLLSEDRRSALEKANQLVKLNRQRQLLERSTTRAAVKKLKASAGFAQRKSIVLLDPSCPLSIAGIVASRMVEEFHKPAIVLTLKGTTAVGSGRSVPGFDLHTALQRCQHLLASFGGHSYAAGVQLPAEQVPAFAECFEAVVQQLLPTEAQQPVLTLSAELPLAEITPAFWRTLRQFAPFGPSNMTPIFLAKKVRDTGHSRVLHVGHVQLSVQQGDGPVLTGIGFELGQRFEELRYRPFDLAFSIEEDHFQAQGTLRLRVRALRPASP